MIAARLANIKASDFKGNQWSPSNDGQQISQNQAAKALNVGTATIERAKRVIKKGIPELQAAVDRGDLTVNAGA